MTSLPYPGGRAWFSDQLAVQPTADNGGPFSRVGDSGSLVVNDQHQAVGVLFCGSQRQSLVNPIDGVLAEVAKAMGRSVYLVTGP